MPEAIFTISADITPQINERELERQAQQIAKQLNGILAKQIDKVGIRPETGNFRPFQLEIDKSRGFIDKLQQSANTLPRTFSNVARSGRSAFLKFTDAINVTRREFVGFGGGIRDTIKATNLFEDALDGIKVAGGSISELPKSFGDLAAQIQSGTSVIDRMAAGGDRLAQVFQPIQQQGEATRTELVDISGALDQLTRVVTQFGAAFGKGIDVTRNDFDLLGKEINELEVPFFRVQAVLNDTGTSATDFGRNLRATFAGAAGDPEQLVKALVALRDESQKTAGPMGLLAQIFGKVTTEERAAAKATRLELNASLIELGQGGHVQGLQLLAARFALIRQSVTNTAASLNDFRLTLANILPGQSPIGKLVASFDTLASGIVTKIRTEFESVKTDLGSAIANVGAGLVQRFDTALAPLAGSFGRSFGQLGRFLETNLNTPVRQGLQTLQVEAVRLGGEISAGLGRGIQNGITALRSAVTRIKDAVVGGLKRLFRISSPSKVTEPIGLSIVQGIVAGITGAAGLIGKALGTLTGGLSQFTKSAVTITGVALAGLAATALHAGIEFNTLQQVVRGTLPVLVGSKQAAAGLLVEINELNDSSPFARSSFLQLTQTLAGFGIEAKKITPLVDAIQQTIAATGGGENDLQELGGAFARIQSQGRLSLDVLQSFSSRGVDAIGILGAEFGKTQSEIREMISGGLVPADKAIDALTKGLKAKFDGATDAVSRNLPGALDRIRAKLRDTGAELTRAFVDPEGGGALVDFLNSMATSLSYIIKNILPPLRPLLEVVAIGFVNLGLKIQSVVTALKPDAVIAFVNKLEGIAPILAGLLGFFPALLGFIPVVGPLLAGLGGPFTALALIIGTIAARSDTVRAALVPVIENFKALFAAIAPMISSVLPKLEALFASLVVAIAPFIAHIVEQAIPFIKQFGVAFSELVVQAQPVVEAIGRLLLSLQPVVDVIFQAGIKILGLSKTFGPISGALVKLIDLLAKIGPIIAAVLTRIIALKTMGIVIAFLDKIVLGLVLKFTSAAAAGGAFSGILTAMGVSAGFASVALGAIVPVLGLIATGIAVFTLFKSKSDGAAESLSKLGDAALSASGKFKILFNTNDLDKFSVSLADLEAKRAAASALEGGAAAKTDIEGFTAETRAIADITKATEDKTKALEQARAAGEQGLIFEAKQAINAQEHGKFRIADASVRAELNAEVLRGATLQAQANITAEKSSGFVQNLTEKLKKQAEAHKSVNQVAEESAAAIKDAYSAATKAVEDATTKMSGAIDSLKQGLSTVDQKLSPLFDAAKAVQATAQVVIDAQQGLITANQSLADANAKVAETTAALIQVEKDRARALEDVISPINELAVATRNLTRLQNGLRDMDRELIDLAKERAALTGERAADDRAGLARAEERAVINLNKAKQAQLDLENELNKTGKVSIDLTGLSLDQIRAKLAAARATAKANGKGEGRDKTAQELADEKTSARLDVEDAIQGVKDSQNASLEFEEGIKTKIRDIDERTLEIADDILDKKLDEETALKGINRLRLGETALQSIILDFDEKIRDVKGQQVADVKAIETASKGIETASKAIETATNGAKEATLIMALKSAEIRGVVGDIVTAQQAIWDWKGKGLQFDRETLTAIDLQKTSVGLLLTDYKNITAEVERTKSAQAALATLQGLGSSLMSAETQSNRINEDVANDRPLNPTQLGNLDKTRGAVATSLRAVLGSGAAIKNGQPLIFRPQDIETIIKEAMSAPTGELRQILHDIFARFGATVPGFETGYAPGEIHQGMNNGRGLARMFEFGKEAVLPLTRKFDMSRIVNNPQVLPKILDALPRWSRPETATITDGDISTNDLSTIVRSARSGGGPANAGVYQKKAQREFASTIGDAVKIAVKEALAESDSLSGADVDINVMPSTGNEHLIAREVRRQVDKALGKW